MANYTNASDSKLFNGMVRVFQNAKKYKYTEFNRNSGRHGRIRFNKIKNCILLLKKLG